MKKALGSLPGVTKVEVDFEKKTATVTADKNKFCCGELVDAALKKVKFGGKVQ